MLLRPSGKQIIFSVGQKNVTLGLLFRSKNGENRACVTKIYKWPTFDKQIVLDSFTYKYEKNNFLKFRF